MIIRNLAVWLAWTVMGLLLFLLALDHISAQESYDYNDGISLYTEAYPVGVTENAELGYTIVYWVVEYHAKDSEGNIHRWREEVEVGPEIGKLTVAQMAANQLVEKLKAGDEQAHGFMKAAQGGQDESQQVPDLRGR